MPAEAAHAAGRFTLRVDNQSERSGLTLRLVNEGGQTVRETQIAEGATEGSMALDLAAGRYTLVVVNYPAWLFHLTAQ